MAFMANLPFVLSAGMGLNAYMAYTVCAGYGYSWHVALLAVFAEGLIFIVLSLTNVREAIFNAIPLTLKRGVSVGIGLFIAIYRSSECGHFSRLFHTGYDHQLPGKFPYRRYLRAAGADRSVYHGGFIHLPCEGRDSVRHSGNLDSRMLCQVTGIYTPDVENGFYTLFPTLGITDFSKLERHLVNALPLTSMQLESSILS